MGFKRPPQIRGLLRAGSGEVQAAQRSYKGERVGKELYIVIHCYWIWAVRVAESVEVRARRLSGWILYDWRFLQQCCPPEALHTVLSLTVVVIQAPHVVGPID